MQASNLLLTRFEGVKLADGQIENTIHNNLGILRNIAVKLKVSGSYTTKKNEIETGWITCNEEEAPLCCICQSTRP